MSPLPARARVSTRHALYGCMRACMLASAAAVASAAGAQGGESPRPQSLPTVTLTAGMYKITAQVAMTPRQREIGLMHRQSMPVQEGMLFVFDQPARQCFWMKNTLLPLSIAFVADDGTIVNLDEMQPNTLTNHCSTRPVRYVLEMNQGWFAKRGIKAGTRLGGQPFGSAPDAGPAGGGR